MKIMLRCKTNLKTGLDFLKVKYFLFYFYLFLYFWFWFEIWPGRVVGWDCLVTKGTFTSMEIKRRGKLKENKCNYNPEASWEIHLLIYDALRWFSFPSVWTLLKKQLILAGVALVLCASGLLRGWWLILWHRLKRKCYSQSERFEPFVMICSVLYTASVSN